MGHNPSSAVPLSFCAQIPDTPAHVPQSRHGWELSSGAIAPTDVIGTIGDHVLTESSKRTTELCGAIVVSACMLKHRGKNTMMFVFPDVAVKAEGTFCLRYRAFNIFSARSASGAIPVLAECFSGPFRVYSTKDFPGLRPSTDLTKRISTHGAVRLNARESVCKRRRRSAPGDDESSLSPASAGSHSSERPLRGSRARE